MHLTTVNVEPVTSVKILIQRARRMKQTVLVMRKMMIPTQLKIISNDTGCFTDFLLIICSIFFYENEVINYNKSIIMWLEI